MPADQITWRLTSDSSQVRSDMMSTVNTVQQGTGAMVNGLNRMDAAHGNLLKSNARVAGQLRNFATDALLGGSGIQTFASAVDAAAHSMKLGLGVTAIGYIGALLIGKFAEATQEVKAFNKELDEAAKPRDPGRTIEQIKEQVAKGAELQKKAVEETKKTWRNFFQDAWGQLFNPNAGGKPVNWKGAKPPEMSPDKKSSVLPDEQAPWRGEGDYNRTWSRRMAQGKAKQPVIDTDIEIANKAKLAAQRDEEDKREIARRESEKKLQESATKKFDSMKFSLAELSTQGRQTAVGDDSRWGAGRAAKEAMKEEALAKKEMLAEHYDAAGQHQQRADTIKNSIMPLKDSEKDFLNAIERAAVFQKIEANTRQQFVNR